MLSNLKPVGNVSVMRMLLIVVGPLLLMALLLFSTGGWAVVEDSNPHGDLSIACNSCHTTEGWKPLLSQLDFDHQKTKFPLVGRHATLRPLTGGQRLLTCSSTAR